jgi:hypothetical protein
MVITALRAQSNIRLPVKSVGDGVPQAPPILEKWKTVIPVFWLGVSLLASNLRSQRVLARFSLSVFIPPLRGSAYRTAL